MRFLKRTLHFAMLLLMCDLIVLIPVSSYAASAHFFYTVRNNDTASTILDQFGISPIYGKRGALVRSTALNPGSPSDKIYPGQKYFLPITQVSQLNDHATVEDSGEVLYRESAIAQAPAPVAAAANTPLTPPARAPSSERATPMGYAAFTPSFLSSKISSTDLGNGSQANLLTKSNVGLGFTDAQLWSEHFQTEFAFGMNTVNFLQPSSGKILANDSEKIYHFGVKGQYSLSDSTQVSLGISAEQQFFAYGASATSITLVPLYVPKAGVGLTQRLVHQNVFDFGARALINLGLPVSSDAFRSKTNFDYQANLFIDHRITPFFVTEAGVSARYENQNTSIVDQHETEYGVYLQFGFFFGSSEESNK